MNTRTLLAALAGGVASFLLGWLVYGILLRDFFMNNTVNYDGLEKDPPVYWAIFAFNLTWSFLIAYIFDRWANIRTFSSGFTAGLLIQFLIGLSINLQYHAFMNLYNGTSMIVDLIVGTLFGGVIAGIIAWVLGYKRTTATVS